MNCAKCNVDVGDGGVGQEDGSILCVRCDEMSATGEPAAFLFDVENTMKELKTLNQPTDLEADRMKELSRQLSALVPYARSKSPHNKARSAIERAKSAGDSDRMLGAGLAILGAVSDDPYAYSTGLSANNRGHIESLRAETKARIRHQVHMPTSDPAIVRLLAERGGSLTKQVIKCRRAPARWPDTVHELKIGSDKRVHGLLRFRLVGKDHQFDLTFNDAHGVWDVDIELELEAKLAASNRNVTVKQVKGCAEICRRKPRS